jgi:hypothetical protein
MEETTDPTQYTMQFSVRNLYGRYLYFPQNPLAAQALETFSVKGKYAKQCFNRDQVMFLKNLGVKIEIVLEDENAKLTINRRRQSKNSTGVRATKCATDNKPSNPSKIEHGSSEKGSDT